MADLKICEGEGLIEKKEENTTKKGDPYWKFVIDGKTYSLFEYEAGKGVRVGDHVGMYWTESQRSFGGKPITYRNLNSIFEKPIEEETVKDTPPVKKAFPGVDTTPATPPKDIKSVNDFKSKEADIYELGMAKNNATFVFCKLVEKSGSLEEVEEYIKTNGDKWDKLVVALYERGKKIRKDILGY